MLTQPNSHPTALIGVEQDASRKLDAMAHHAEFLRADTLPAYAQLATIEDLNGNRGFSTHLSSFLYSTDLRTP